MDGAFVPSLRTFAITSEIEPGRNYTGPLYRYPPIGEAGVVVPPTALAVARQAIDELRDLAQGKTPFGSGTVLRQRGVAHAKLGRAEAILRSARQLFYATLDEAWDRTVAGTPSTLEQKADLALAGAHAVASAVQAVDLVYSLAGTRRGLRPQPARASLPRRADDSPSRLRLGGPLRDGGPGLPRRGAGVGFVAL